MGHEPAKRLEVKINGQTKVDDVVVVCYRPADQEEKIDKTFFRQLEEVSYSWVLVLVGGLQPPCYLLEGQT